MTYLIAAAGTGGHVYPGLAVGERLHSLGVPKADILFAGGNRLEAQVYPDQGFPFLELELRGLQRSLTVQNLALPGLVRRARNRVLQAIVECSVHVVLGMGGYVTIPAGWAARRAGVVLLNSEQNAEAGLANRIASRWARRSFGAFPKTAGMPKAEWVGNPVREPFWNFDRSALRARANQRYELRGDLPVLGVFGGSLGAGVINEAVLHMVRDWEGPELQIIHLTGERNFDGAPAEPAPPSVMWRRVGSEPAMELFYAAADLVVCRAGGAVAELTATASPSILIPGAFGSAGHQAANARALEDVGAAITLREGEVDELGDVVMSTLFDDVLLEKMAKGTMTLAKPGAADSIARAMIELAE